MLRDYQQKALDELFKWLKENEGNPCLCIPTGGGKSHIVAELCKTAIEKVPTAQILMLTHQKELIAQNAEKLKAHWNDAPLGIYSAGLKKKEIKQVVFGGIQSIHRKAEEIGPRRLVIVDECHLINHKNEGMYRRFLDELREIEPRMRVIGLTATPFRLGHGYIHEGDGLFDALLEPVTVKELIDLGYLTRLWSKMPEHTVSTEGIHKRGGEFIESEIQARMDTESNNHKAVNEIMDRGADRLSWLIFCTGVDHSYHIRDILRERGVTCETVTGETPHHERDRILADFKSGKIRAVTNANVLTTGFDHPAIDLIALLRPTMSPALYLQMVGRGLRISEKKENCKVLDFVGAVATHGPIINVQPPKKKGEKAGEAPVKVCPDCQEILHLSVMKCPECGYIFPKEEKSNKLQNDDIMGELPKDKSILFWKWAKHYSKKSGDEMIKVSYHGATYGRGITEYFAIKNKGYAGDKSKISLYDICKKSGLDHERIKSAGGDIDRLCFFLNRAKPPKVITYKMAGKWPRITERTWNPPF